MISAESTMVMIRFFLSMAGRAVLIFLRSSMVDAISADRRPQYGDDGRSVHAESHESRILEGRPEPDRSRCPPRDGSGAGAVPSKRIRAAARGAETLRSRTPSRWVHSGSSAAGAAR